MQGKLFHVKNRAHLCCPPKFLTINCQLLEGQQGQLKHNESLSGSIPISSGIKQGCILTPTLFSIFLCIMLYEAKEDLPESIYIRFLTGQFDLCLFAHMKTMEELITELLFADDCTLLMYTEEALQHIINSFFCCSQALWLHHQLEEHRCCKNLIHRKRIVLFTSALVAPT